MYLILLYVGLGCFVCMLLFIRRFSLLLLFSFLLFFCSKVSVRGGIIETAYSIDLCTYSSET